ncbi:MAG TPA: metal ABC transporter permease [Methanocorpusculum sp.]|nr:metal ABC transporter permease [Methanocorpusculum sp.]
MVCHATEAMIFASIGCAILAVLITQMKISSIGFTMSHGAFAGAMVGVFCGINMTMGALIGSFILACILGPLSEKSKMPVDTILGVLFGLMMAIAIFFYTLMQQSGMSDPTTLLFGSVISLSRQDIYNLFIIMAIVILFVIVFYKEISAMVFNRKIAEITGIKTKPIIYLSLFMIAVMVALTLPIVGGLLLYVWLVIPAAIAYQFSNTLKQMIFLAPILAAIISLIGTSIAFYYNLPVAPFVAMLFAGIFTISVFVSPKRQIAKLHQ